jgi:hypothetical protein
MNRSSSLFHFVSGLLFEDDFIIGLLEVNGLQKGIDQVPRYSGRGIR